jgi:hypothetical protein
MFITDILFIPFNTMAKNAKINLIQNSLYTHVVLISVKKTQCIFIWILLLKIMNITVTYNANTVLFWEVETIMEYSS